MWRIVQSAQRFGRFMLQNYALMLWVRHFQASSYQPGRVSVITPTYNRPDVLLEAIESVRTQTYTNWEHLVVSDGRDDRVASLVRQIADPRVRSYHTWRLPVMGNYQRNVALRFASGEFILYLDDDNIIYPACLETMVGGFVGDHVGYVVCPIRYGDSVKHPPRDFRYREIDLLNYMVRRRLVVACWGQSVHANADYLLIKHISRLSQGVFLDDLVGHHR